MRWRQPLRTSWGWPPPSSSSLGFLLAGAGPAAAHAELIGTDPATGRCSHQAPDRGHADLQRAGSAHRPEITVYDADGETLPPRRRPPAPRSSSTCPTPTSWAAAASSSRGSSCPPTATRSPGRSRSRSASAATRWPSHPRHRRRPAPSPRSRASLGGLLYLGLLVAAGLGRVRRARPAGRRTTASGSVGRIRRLVRVAAGLGAAGRAGLRSRSPSVYAQGAELSDVLGRGSTPRWSSTSWSRPRCWSSASASWSRRSATGPRPDAQRFVLLGGAALALAVSPAVVGHTRSYQPTVAAARVRHRPPPGRGAPGSAAWSGWSSRCAPSPVASSWRPPPWPASPRWPAACCSRSPLAGTVLALADPRLLVGLRRHRLRACCCWSRSGWPSWWPASAAGTGSGCCRGSAPRSASPSASAPPAWSPAPWRSRPSCSWCCSAVTGFLVNRLAAPGARSRCRRGAPASRGRPVADLEVYAVTVTAPRRAATRSWSSCRTRPGEPVTPPRPPVSRAALRATSTSATVPLAHTDVGTYRAESCCLARRHVGGAGERCG